MFTGIVTTIGTLHAIHKQKDRCEIVVDTGDIATDSIHVGDSVAVNGACLTITEVKDGHAWFAISPETIAQCLVGEWREGESLNLELPLTLQTALGGHLVMGHIDDVGALIERSEAGDCVRMQFEVTHAVGKFIAEKGSITIDGVSLTVNEVEDTPEQTRFTVMIVPHTLQVTNLGKIQPGARVHIEVDPLARYLQRLIDSSRSEPSD